MADRRVGRLRLLPEIFTMPVVVDERRRCDVTGTLSVRRSEKRHLSQCLSGASRRGGLMEETAATGLSHGIEAER